MADATVGWCSMKEVGSYMFARDPYPSRSGKTQVWVIVDRNDGMLGDVRWFGRWRCYAFHPEPATVFNAACMRSLALFCESVTEEHRKK